MKIPELQSVFKLQHKILKHPEHLLAWHLGEIPPPISGEIHPTNQCNNACTYCFYKDLHKSGQNLSFGQMVTIVEQLVHAEQKALVFSGGGEPLMNKDTPAVVEYTKEIGLEVGFITNGQLITPQIAKILVQNCIWIRVSLSATTRQTFKEIRGVDNFDAALNGILELLSAKKATESKATIGLQWIYTRLDPVNNLITFVKNWAQGKGIDYIQLLCEQSFDKEVLNKQRDLPAIALRLQRLQPTNPAIIYSKADDLRLPNFGRNYDTCEGHWFTSAIGADGKVYICCHLIGDERFAFGDLQQENFKTVWHSPKRQEIAKSINVEECLHLCKHHEVNKLLGKLKKLQPHQNFL